MDEAKRRALGLAIVVLFLGTGCQPKRSTVSGTVRFDHATLKGGSVILYCEGDQIVRGIIAEDGTFTIADVPRGRAVVTVKSHPRAPEGMRLNQSLPPASPDAPRPPTPPASGQDQPMVIPSRYGTPEESGIVVTIDRNQQTLDIDLPR